MIAKTITLKAGRTQKNLRRLTKWAGFEQDRRSGSLNSPNYYGFVVIMPDYHYIQLDRHTRWSRRLYPLSSGV